MVAQTLIDLTREQIMLTDRIVDTQHAVEVSRARLEADQAALSRAVYDAMDQGVAARTIADLLGVSLGRVYQLRNIIDQS